MKDSEFIELLNLYIDHEISPADAARLETEVLAHPVRRQTYQQYCRLQKACKLFTTEFPTAADPADRKIVAFEPVPRRSAAMGRFVAIGGLAAAACLAVIFGLRNRDLRTSETAPIARLEPVVAPAAPGLVHAVNLSASSVATVGNPLLLSGRAQADALLAAAVEQTDKRFDWMRTVQLSPLPQRLPAESLRFETLPPATTLESGTRVYGRPLTDQADAEWVSFRFSK